MPDGLYGVGYDGWGDITDPQAVRHLQGLGIRYCRIAVNLANLCGERLGDWQWETTEPRDVGLGFVSRLRRIRALGWTPILALTTTHALPKWFRGEPTDAGGDPWYLRNLDGSAAAEEQSDQWAELERVAQGLAAGLAAQGLRGLWWETAYESGHTLPMAETHYHAGIGIRRADPTAKLMGPATWPGWTVEERFVKPFLSRYGADLLDGVSLHWYADNEHGLWVAPGWKDRHGPVTMADRLFLQYLMETTPKYAQWCRSLRKTLDDPTLNPARKPIAIVYTEFDALAESAYGRNPENPDWPDYSPSADCYLNTNYFGGVWSASVLCHLAASGAADIVCKFNTRQFYGLVDNAPGGGFYRQPVWFAWKLLRDMAGVRPGAAMLVTSVSGPRDSAAAHVGGEDSPWIEAFAVRRPDGPAVILINRSLDRQDVEVSVNGSPQWDHAVGGLRYLFASHRVARFIGRQPGTAGEGAFEGVPDDALSARCLQPLRWQRDSRGSLRVRCPAVSLTILTPRSAP
ncbi:MAG: hypothetical protein HPY69_02680 [Armatimonadetes bacterium]|nr:hypothetical protein [Armatimonadota bacterium]